MSRLSRRVAIDWVDHLKHEPSIYFVRTYKGIPGSSEPFKSAGWVILPDPPGWKSKLERAGWVVTTFEEVDEDGAAVSRRDVMDGDEIFDLMSEAYAKDVMEEEDEGRIHLPGGMDAEELLGTPIPDKGLSN